MQTTYDITQNQLMQEERRMYDSHAERAFLALLIKFPEMIVEAEPVVKPEMLNLELNNYIYKLMLFIYRDAVRANWNLNFDPMYMLMVARQCGPEFEKSFIEKTDGSEHLRAVLLIKDSMTKDQLPQLMHRVRAAAKRVEGYRQARFTQTRLMDISTNPSEAEVLMNAENAFGALAHSMGTAKDGALLGESAADVHTKIRLTLQYPDAMLFNVAIPGFFPFWMDLMGGGFPRNGLSVIAARPKVGKSTLLLCIAIIAAMNGIPVLYFDTEMSKDEQYLRAMSFLTREYESQIKKGALYADPLGAQFKPGVEELIQRLYKAPFEHVDAKKTDPDELASRIRKFVNQRVGKREFVDKVTGQKYIFSMPAIVIYDWLKVGDIADLGKNVNETQALGNLCTILKDAAFANNIPVIAGAQNNREAINADTDSFGDAAEGMIANSDRILQFCTQLCSLRNLKHDELDEVTASDLPKRTDLPAYDNDERNKLPYTHIMYVVVQRAGGDYKQGIPVYLHRGTATFEEKFWQTDQYGRLVIENSLPVDSPCKKHWVNRKNNEKAQQAKSNLPKQQKVDAAKPVDGIVAGGSPPQ